MTVSTLSDSWPLTFSGNLDGELERDGVREGNGNETGALVAREAETPRETTGGCALSSVVDCGAPGVIDMRGCAALAPTPYMCDSSPMPNDRRGPLETDGGKVGEESKGDVKDWEWWSGLS